MKRPSYRLTRAADRALDELYRHGIETFGLRQAQDYLLGLHETFEMLARFPEVGRPFREFRRHEHGSHIIFYEIEDGAVIIVDVVRQGRDLDAWRA
ncbi:MAG TPA: type II toxin-antitoxin system RelE/ParE family toxin [Hyphomonadaceae bacterium]|nr:type II toxin-antitoxin system RelE/ParE family toxin [Hyphomonadaceae bacterium]